MSFTPRQHRAIGYFIQRHWWARPVAISIYPTVTIQHKLTQELIEHNIDELVAEYDRYLARDRYERRKPKEVRTMSLLCKIKLHAWKRRRNGNRPSTDHCQRPGCTAKRGTR